MKTNNIGLINIEKAILKQQIFADYSSVRSVGQKVTPANTNENYLLPFLERIDIATQQPTTNVNTNHYFTKKRKLIDTYEDFSVEGIILNVDKFTLRTPAVIVDALLGQGEALDCYAQKLQEQVILKAKNDNQRLQTEISKMTNDMNLDTQKLANEFSINTQKLANDLQKQDLERLKIEKGLEILEEMKQRGADVKMLADYYAQMFNNTIVKSI